MTVALLYLTTSLVLIGLVHRCFTPLTRGAVMALVLLPLCFTWRPVLTDRVYAPVEMPYLAQPLRDHSAEFGVRGPYNGRLADIAFQMIPWREATRRALGNGEWPLFNRFELCGNVLAAAAQPAVFSPFTLIACLLPSPLSFTYTGVIAFLMAGLGAFLLARELGCSVEASVFAAAGWMFSGPVALMVLWPIGFAWNLLPLVLAATHRLVHAPGPRSVAILAASLSLEILAGHPETLLHVTAIAVVFGLFELQKQKEKRAAVLVGAALGGILALGLTAIDLLPFLDALQQTSEHGIRLLFARAPLHVAGGFTRATFLGDLFPWFGPERWHLPGDAVAGSIVVALAIHSICFLRTRRTWFFAALLVLCLLAGTNSWPVAQLLHALPLFRQALNERLAAAVPLALSILAAFAIDTLQPRRLALICIALLTIDGVVLCAGPPADLRRLLADVIPLALAAALLFIRLPARAFGALLLALLVGQRFVADGSMIPVHDPRVAYPRLALFRPMEQVTEPFRITGGGSALLPNTATMYGLEDIRGSTAMTLARLAETFPMWSTVGMGRFHTVPDLSRPILSMMNVRFAMLDVSAPIPSGWRDVTYDVFTRLVENPRVLPRAYVPRSVRIGRSPQQELDEMAAESDFGERAWLAIEDRPHDRANGSGEVSVRTAGNGLDIDVAKKGDGFIVISEAAWSGWRAYVDGKRVTVLRADHAFLAVFVPDGHHAIVLRFLPESFVIGRTITILTMAILLAAIVLFRLRRTTRP